MITVTMREDRPDVDLIEELVTPTRPSRAYPRRCTPT
jgi:hypothetical protein